MFGYDQEHSDSDEQRSERCREQKYPLRTSISHYSVLSRLPLAGRMGSYAAQLTRQHQAAPKNRCDSNDTKEQTNDHLWFAGGSACSSRLVRRSQR